MLQDMDNRNTSKEITITHTIKADELIMRTYFIAPDGTKLAYAIPKRYLVFNSIGLALIATGVIIGIIWQIPLSFLGVWLTWLPFTALIAFMPTSYLGYYEVDEQGFPTHYIGQNYTITDEKRMSKRQFLQSVQN